jgi:hypothetical protein
MSSLATVEPVTAKKHRTSEPAITEPATIPTTTIPSTLDNNDAITTSSDDPAPKEMSSWTCRLPFELMSLVLEHLTENQALGTLASVQSTSRAMYTLATPYLYRHIIINEKQALKLFRLFNIFPRNDNRIFLDPVPTNKHLLDLQLPHRLRSFFSHTTALLFRLAYFPSIADSDDEDYDLDRYVEVVQALSALGQPRLWPAIQRCDLDMDANSSSDIYMYRNSAYHAYDAPSLANAIFTDMHPSHLSIVLPTPLSSEIVYINHHCWEDIFSTLEADNVEMVNLSGWTAGKVPCSTSSLVLNFRETRPEHDENLDIDCTCHVLFNGCAPLLGIEYLKLVGMPDPRDGTALDLDDTVARSYLIMEPYMRRCMQIRQEDGNMDDLKVTIQPDSSPEGVLAAVSRIYKQPIPV